MAKKHSYTINFNGGSKQPGYLYKFGTVKNISLHIGKQRATVSYQTGKEWEADDVVTLKDRLFRDAYRKVYLLHAITQDQGLKVNSIEVIIDGVSTMYDDSRPLFPFMFSMIQKNRLGLCEKWKELTSEVIKTPKYKFKNDHRYIAMFSYLASKSKYYEVERFNFLWTAVNACYSYIAFNYEALLRKELGVGDDQKLPDKLCLSENDYGSVGALCWILSGRFRVTHRKEAEKIWESYETEKTLCDYDEYQIKALYKAAKSELSGEPLPLQYKKLSTYADKFGASLYTYLLLIYPYHWRCDLFHGNRTTLLFCAYNDYEIAAIRTVNYFLDTFLNEFIPDTFKPEFPEKYYEDVKQYMRKFFDFDKIIKKYQRQIIKRGEKCSS